MGKGTNYVKKPTLLDASYQGVHACMEKGTNRRLIRRMDDFVNTIKKEITNAYT